MGQQEDVESYMVVCWGPGEFGLFGGMRESWKATWL